MGSWFNMLIFNIVDPRRFAIVQLIYGLAYFLIINRLIDIRILHITIIIDFALIRMWWTVYVFEKVV